MRMLWLDLFRGLAALVVMVYHFSIILGLPRIQFGYLAVDLFFVLSGIVLFGRYDAEIRSGMRALEFAWHRVRRLYPMVVITVVFLLLRNAARATSTFPVTPGTDTLSVLGLLTLLPLSHGTPFAFPADGNIWSLLAEFLSNAVWFAALRFWRHLLTPIFVASSVAAVYFAWSHGSFDYGANPGWQEVVRALARALAGFGIGCWIARRRPLSDTPPLLPLAMLVLACAACQIPWTRGLLSELIVILSGAALLSTLMHRSPKSAWAGKLFGYLGMLSFPLYLIHPACKGFVVMAVAHGMNNVVAVIVIPLGVAIGATFVNEAIVRRLPSQLTRKASPAVTTQLDKPSAPASRAAAGEGFD